MWQGDKLLSASVAVTCVSIGGDPKTLQFIRSQAQGMSCAARNFFEEEGKVISGNNTPFRYFQKLKEWTAVALQDSKNTATQGK